MKLVCTHQEGGRWRSFRLRDWPKCAAVALHLNRPGGNARFVVYDRVLARINRERGTRFGLIRSHVGEAVVS